MNNYSKKRLQKWAYWKFKGKCAYCGGRLRRDEITLDHIVPKCLGGTNHQSNIALCCEKCNGLKRDKTPQVWRMEMLDV